MPSRKRQKREVEEPVPEVEEDDEEEQEESEEQEEESGEENGDDDEQQGNEDEEEGDDEELEEDEEEEEEDGGEAVEDVEEEEEEEEEEDEEEEEEEEAEDASEEEDGADAETETDSRPSRRSSRRASKRSQADNSRRRGKGNVDNTSLMPSHGAMTSASTTNTPSSVGRSLKRASSSRRRRSNANDDDGSDFDDDADKDDETFAASTLPNAEHDKRPFKNLDVTTQIPIRVMRKKKGVPNEIVAKKYSIPAPPTTAAALNFEKILQGTFKLPESYIRFRHEMIRPLDYEMTFEDEAWLKAKYPKMPQATFEKVFTTFEVVQGSGIQLNQAKAFQYVQRVDPTATKQVSDDLFSYWGSRRGKSKRPLLRRFWPVTPAEDQTPTLTFRPREKERYRLRKKRQNDIESYEKLCYLKRDFDRFKDLLELTRRREELKRLEADLVHAEYVERLHPTNQRPACLNTPLPALLDVPENFDFLGMHQHTEAPRMPLPPISIRIPSQARNETQHAQPLEDQKIQQKKSGSRGRRSESEGDYSRHASGAASVISTATSVASVDERKLPPTVVPVPRYLLEPVTTIPIASGLETIYPPQKRRLQALKLDHVPRQGRNRRLVYERIHIPRDAQIILNQPKVVTPFAPPLDRFNKLMGDDMDSDDEHIDSVEQLLLRPSGAYAIPRFQLMLRPSSSS